MGCTHSKNSKSKSAKAKSEQPLEQGVPPPQNRIAHFDETNQTAPSTSNESDEQQQPAPPPHYSKNLLGETGESTNQKTMELTAKGIKKHETKTKTATVDQNEHLPPSQSKNQPVETPLEKKDSAPHTAIAPPIVAASKQYVPSAYYPMPTAGTDKQKSPEKKKSRKKNLEVAVEQEEKKKKKEYGREKPAVVGPNYRPQLTPDDLECIRRSVQQRNERRAYMMAHRNETDDTLYELEVRMPEKDYTNRIDPNSRVY